MDIELKGGLVFVLYKGFMVMGRIEEWGLRGKGMDVVDDRKCVGMGDVRGLEGGFLNWLE